MLITWQPQKLKKNKHRFGILKYLEYFDLWLTKHKKIKFINKNSWQIIVTAKLFNEGHIPIILN